MSLLLTLVVCLIVGVSYETRGLVIAPVICGCKVDAVCRSSLVALFCRVMQRAEVVESAEAGTCRVGAFLQKESGVFCRTGCLGLAVLQN